jgi:hypothetical protein
LRALDLLEGALPTIRGHSHEHQPAKSEDAEDEYGDFDEGGDPLGTR